MNAHRAAGDVGFVPTSPTRSCWPTTCPSGRSHCGRPVQAPSASPRFAGPTRRRRLARTDVRKCLWRAPSVHELGPRRRAVAASWSLQVRIEPAGRPTSTDEAKAPPGIIRLLAGPLTGSEAALSWRADRGPMRMRRCFVGLAVGAALRVGVRGRPEQRGRRADVDRLRASRSRRCPGVGVRHRPRQHVGPRDGRAGRLWVATAAQQGRRQRSPLPPSLPPPLPLTSPPLPLAAARDERPLAGQPRPLP